MAGQAGWRSDVDVAIVGAGSAGLGAARRLAAVRPDLSLLVLEAAERIGGRALTASDGSGLDLGCGWLHGARDNAWTTIAESMGIAVDRTAAPWSRGTLHRGTATAEREAASAAMQAFFDRADAPADADSPLSTYLEPGNRWNAMIGAVATYINGAELEEASAEDLRRYKPGRPPDWRVRSGYGALIAAFGADVPVALSTPVATVDHSAAERIALHTARGTLRCRAAVVTISSTCLAEEGLRFDPPLPDKRDAAAGVPVGVANKVFLDLAAPEALPQGDYVHGHADRVETGAYHLRPYGLPVIEGYYGGAMARRVEAMPAGEAAAFAIDELVALFGSDLRRHLSLRMRSAWGGNPWTRGSYSYARPGCADARAVLARPVDDRLFFAGEACSPHRFSTAHGAYETGVGAADAIAAAL